jgi:MFS family permease
MDRRAFVALTIAMLTIAVGVGLIVPLLPVYADELGASGIWIGLIFGINPLVSGTFTLFLGSRSDALDKKQLISFGLVGFTCIAIGFMMARTPVHLFVARVIQGACGACVLPIARAYAGELVPRGQEGRTMGLFNLAFVGGFAAGPTFGGLLWDAFGRQAPFAGMASMTLLALVLVQRFVPSRRPALAARRPAGVDLRPLSDPHIAGNVLLRATMSVGHGVFMVLLPLVAEREFGLGSSQIGLLVTMRAGTEGVMQPIMGRVADRVDRRLQVVAASGLMALALALMPLARTYSLLVAITVLFGLGGGAAMPASTAITVDKGRRWGMGSLIGLEQVAQSLGMAAGSSGSGVVMEAWSPWAAFRAAGLIAAVGVAAFWRWSRGYAPEHRQLVVEVAAGGASGGAGGGGTGGTAWAEAEAGAQARALPRERVGELEHGRVPVRAGAEAGAVAGEEAREDGG